MSRSATPGKGRRLDWALLLGDFAIASWLWFSFWSFNGRTELTPVRVLAPAAASALIALLLCTHRQGAGSRLGTAARFTGLAIAVAALARGAAALRWIPVSGWEASWLGAASSVTLLILRSFYHRLSGSRETRSMELLRWLAVGLAATLVMLPYYFAGALGAGDAHWYVLMLSDFLAQLKAGVFPVWVGQSPYAFNGAVSPIRYAPGFQYYGGMVDFLTGQALHPVAVKNLCLCLSAVGGSFSAYACLRPIVNARRWIACLLAVLWIAGPGVLAPLYSGDQYMTFIALPFVPLVLHGCWRVLVLDDLWGRLWISSGLAALWLCHPPIGLWMTLISGSMYLGAMLLRRRWLSELRRLALMGAVFLGMGSLPFVSLLNLDNQIHVASAGGSAAEEVHRYFPGNFLPINPAGGGLMDYQIGYALLGALAVSLMLLAFSRPKGAWGFALASLLIVPFTVPVPGVTDPIWVHTPGWIVTIDNVWPMQRLFLIWSAVAAFFCAIVLGSERISGARWRHASVIALLALGLLWSASEAHKLSTRALRSRTSPETTRIMEGPTNTQIGRYAYGSFETTPGYASHGYMDAWFENRLLDRDSLQAILTNADAAAPGDGAGPGNSTLVARGLMTAENITQSTSYFLRPTLILDPGKHYALRLEFFEQRLEGILQLMQDTLFREYLLPDSGAGIGRSGPPRAFGTEPTSGRVISLSVLGNGPAPVRAILITPRATTKDFNAARYWLYTYERSRLPIAVESWFPYRVRFASPGPTYLESPRMWLKDWHATVNGVAVPTQRSPENLVMVPVQAGPNTVTLEYIPPAIVRASFWALFACWTAAGALALAWLLNVAPARAVREAAWLAAVWQRRLPLAAVIGAAAAVAFYCLVRTSAPKVAYSNSEGPIEVRFMLSSGGPGTTQPLLSTGHAQAGVVVFATRLDERHIQLGADVWGDLYKSGPIEIDFSQVHTLVVSDSALFPENRPAVAELPQVEEQRLRHELRVELDGFLEIEASRYAFEAGPNEIFVGSAPFGSTSSAKFTDGFIDSRRLPIPRLLSMPAGGHAHLRLRFPMDRAGETESLLTLRSGADVYSFSVTYAGHDRIMIAVTGPDGTTRRSPAIETDMPAAHTMEFWPTAPSAPKETFGMSCALDGRLLFGDANSSAMKISMLLSSGVNLTAAHAAQVRFSGPELELTVSSAGPSPVTREELGPAHMIMTFPSHRTGRHEPILTTGRTGAGDLIYVIYEDDQHIRVGFDHWGAGAILSDPIAIDYTGPHDIWVIEGSLYPPEGDDAFWGTTAPATRRVLKSTVAVVIDGKTVLSAKGATHPTTGEQVTFAKNRIGGSTADPDFSGIIHLSERSGMDLPQGLDP